MLIEFVLPGQVDAGEQVEAVDGARARVEQVGDGIESLLAANRQVGGLGQALSDQTVGMVEFFFCFGLGLYLVVSLLRGSIHAGRYKVVDIKENPVRFFAWWLFWLLVVLFIWFVGFEF